MGVQWIKQESGEDTPQNAIRGGQEKDGQPIFVGRAHSPDGGVHPGKFGPTTGRGVLYSYADKEDYSGEYELLVGDEDSITWVECQGNIGESSGWTPVEGGQDSDGTPLWVAQIEYDGGVFVGKASPKLDGARFGYGGKEEGSHTYKVLANK